MSIQDSLNRLFGGVGRASSTLQALQGKYDDAVDEGQAPDPDMLALLRKKSYDLRQLLQQNVDFAISLERTLDEAPEVEAT